MSKSGSLRDQTIESRIIASLERISQAFRVLLWQESKEFSLSPIQVQVIIFLLHHSREKRKVSYTIKTLEQKQLIRKEEEPEDTRSYIISLTDKGRDIAGKTSLFTNEIRTPVDLLNEDDKENLLLSLTGIIRHLNKTGVITVQRMCQTCSYYRSSGDGQHFCKLLNQSLEVKDLRVDCPEYEMKIE
jgi:hypothetical protein